MIAQLKEHLTKVRENLTTLLVGAILSGLICTVIIIEQEQKSENKSCHLQVGHRKLIAKVENLTDYTALYVFKGANVILMDKRPKYNALHLNAEQLVTLTNFTHKCILCDHFERCAHKESVRLPPNSINTLLAVPFFTHCQLPAHCYLFGQHFNCRDLVSLTKLTT
jgi:hypothetical protein